MVEAEAHRIRPHSEKQDSAIFSDHPITAVLTGIQWGKTKSLCLWMKRQMHKHTDRSDNFIITAPNYKIMQQATVPEFLRLMDGFGAYNKTDAIFKMHHGGQCFLRTATDPDSVVGITNVRAIGCDEAGKYPLYFWENIQGRSSFKKAPIYLASSPYSLNWVYKDIIRPVTRGERNDVLLVQASSKDNPYFSEEEYNRKKRTMDKRRFDMMYGGEWNLMAGLVYDCFSHEENICESFSLPVGTKYYAGVDWGYTDPFVVVIHGITPQGGRYQVSEFYKTGTTIKDQIEIAVAKQKIYDIERWYCDPSRPDSIEQFQRSGLMACGADNSIRMGVDMVYEEIKSRNFKFFSKANPYSIDELEMYHYPDEQDLKPDKATKDLLPVGQGDHAMDAIRYVTISTKPRKMVQSDLPKRKPKVNKKHTENW